VTSSNQELVQSSILRGLNQQTSCLDVHVGIQTGLATARAFLRTAPCPHILGLVFTETTRRSLLCTGTETKPSCTVVE